ncbi:hypothetical protein EIP91_008689 [Steccherinum ochraceum]|uniref:Uncharacterized protein n=1 Tax=Steccherinum ochraceum TaxID=92696 RepID=A0A4R0R576_9APHY|nr:hypothetical protein EIP91_008689 [Steccherinum ochraceum]
MAFASPRFFGELERPIAQLEVWVWDYNTRVRQIVSSLLCLQYKSRSRPSAQPQAFFNAILDPFNTSPSPDANEPNTSDRRLNEPLKERPKPKPPQMHEPESPMDKRARQRHVTVHLNAHYGQRFYVEVINKAARFHDADVEVTIPRIHERDLGTAFCRSQRTITIFNVRRGVIPFAPERTDSDGSTAADDKSSGEIIFNIKTGVLQTTYEIPRPLNNHQQASTSRKRPQKQLPTSTNDRESSPDTVDPAPPAPKRRRVKKELDYLANPTDRTGFDFTHSVPEPRSSFSSQRSCKYRRPLEEHEARSLPPSPDLNDAQSPSPPSSRAGTSRRSVDTHDRVSDGQLPAQSSPAPVPHPSPTRPQPSTQTQRDAESPVQPSPQLLDPTMNVDVKEEERPSKLGVADPSHNEGDHAGTSGQVALILKELEELVRDIDAFSAVVLAKYREDASLPATNRSAKTALQRDIETKKQKRAQLFWELRRVTGTATSREVKVQVMDFDVR